MAHGRIVAVGLLTQRDLDALGANFRHLWPIDEAPCFSSLLQAIDEADRQLWRERDSGGEAAQLLPDEASPPPGSNFQAT
jgi:hypothetical protein